MQAPEVGHSRHNDFCDGSELQVVKTTSFVQINSQLRKAHVEEEEEPLNDDIDNSTPALDVAEVTSPVAMLLTKVAPPGKDLSSRTLVAPPGKDSSSKASVSASLHPEAVPRGQNSYQGQAPSVGTKFLLEFKRFRMLLRDHMILRLRQWHEFAANTGQQRSAAATVALVGAGVVILIVTFAVLSRAQVGGDPSALSDYPRLGQGRGLSERSQKGTVSKLTTAKLTTAGILTNKDLTPQSKDVVGLSQMSTTGQGPEGTEENPDPDSYFCPDLVVPPGCEVILKVPITTLSQGPFDVTDINDSAVLHVEPRALNLRPSIVPGGRGAEPRQQYRLVLTREYGTIMAQCGPSLTEARECVLLRAAGDHFAKITGTEEKSYTLTTCTGSKLFFWGSFEDHAINVIDSAGKLVAKTGAELPASSDAISVAASKHSQGAPIYRLRVAPLADVGLVLCGLLCIQHIL